MLAAATRQSPTRALYWPSRATEASCHLSCSPPSPSSKAFALVSFFWQSRMSSCSLCFCCLAFASLSCKASNYSMMPRSSACFFASPSSVSWYFCSASFARARFGATILTTPSYWSRARTHWHRPLAANEAFSTLAGLKSGSGINYSLILRITESGMLSRSKSSRPCRKFFSAMNF